MTTKLEAAVLDARPVHVPLWVLLIVVAGAWPARWQQAEPGRHDLAFAVFHPGTSRVSRDLGWFHTVGAVIDLRERVSGRPDDASDDTPVLRYRSVLELLGDAARRGPVSSRRRP
jgi:UDP-glucose 4-epimerase